MKFKICQEINKCRTLWNLFSPKKRLFDIWEFRACFYDSKDDKPYFIIGYDGKEISGVIPLQFVKSENQYHYFGGWFTAERNRFLLKDKTKIIEFLEQCPKNTFIEGIDPEEGKYYNFLEDEPTYYLDLSKYGNSFERYFSSFDKKKQKNFKRDLKNIPSYKMYPNRLGDFGRLLEFNMQQQQ